MTQTIYFDAQKKDYWVPNSRGNWITNNETQIQRVLRNHGISDKRPDGDYVSPLDKVLVNIQQDNDIHFAGPLAGYSAGIHHIVARRILVTESPILIEPVRGPWPVLDQLFEGMLCDKNVDQRPHFFGWLKVGMEALRAEKPRPGQALALCGERESAKSLTQRLITLLLGGRAAKPYQFMAGHTPFNGDLFFAEHLMIEDEQASKDQRSRQAFGSMIKGFAVNEIQHCHAKNRQAIELTPLWRVTISVNDEPEHIQVLPPLDDSISDKIMLLKAYKMPMPMPTTTGDERESFMNTLKAELPAFIDHLLNEFVIPEKLVCPRFGIKHYHHVDVLNALDALAPETRLLFFIDAVLFEERGVGGWTGSAEELQRKLCDTQSQYAYEVRQLLKHSNTCGTYLSRLSKQSPARVFQQRNKHKRNWRIEPPFEEDDAMTASSVLRDTKEYTQPQDEGEEQPSCRHPEEDTEYEEFF